jgi:molybdenum cofactor cytidylyltransferase
MGLGGVILAAGESTRMGRDKALLPWPPDSPSQMSASRGTILSAAINALREHCDMVIVVAGNNEPALRKMVESSGALLVRNPAPERGQFSSLQTGLREVLNQGRDTAIVTLVDRPPPEAGTLDGLVNFFAKKNHNVWALVPEYQGRHGHPILVGREIIEKFLRAPATANASEIEHANMQHISYLPVNDPLVTANVDTPEEYASLQFQKP